MTEPTATIQYDGPPTWTDERGVFCIRASAMGGTCTRAAVALYQGMDKMSPPDQQQRRFDDGHLHEESILKQMSIDAEVEIHRLTETVVYVVVPGKIEIHGHLDGIVAPLGEGVEAGYAPAEAKAFSDKMFASYLAKGGPAELFGYGMQAKVYMLATGSDKILYGVKNKNSGVVDVRWVADDAPGMPTKAQVLLRATELYRACTDISSNPMTMECDRAQWPCPVYYIHQEIEKVEVEDQVLKEMLANFKTLQAIEKKAKSEKDKVGLEIADRLEVIGEDAATVLGWSVSATVGSTSGADWELIEKLTGMKKEQLTTTKPNSKATVTVTAPKGWTPGQGELL